jgi:hypothetical protein
MMGEPPPGPAPEKMSRKTKMKAISGIPFVGPGGAPIFIDRAQLPMMLGQVGSMAGGGKGPLSMAGSTVGGGMAQALNELAMGAVGEPEPHPFASIAEEAVQQAGINATGQLLPYAPKAAGQVLMRAGLKAPADVAATAIREGITHTKQGVVKLMGNLGDAGATTLAMLRHSTMRGTRFDPVSFLSGGEQSLVQQVGENITPQSLQDVKVFKRLSTAFLERNQGQLTPLQLQKFKQQANDIADPLWQKANIRKESLTGMEAATMRWYKSMASHAQHILEQTTPDMIHPMSGQIQTLAERNAYTQSLMKLKDLIVPTAGKGAGVWGRIAARGAGPAAGATVGALLPGDRAKHSLEGMIAGGAATSPELLSWLALRMNGPAVASTLRNMPRAIGYLAGGSQ